MTRLSLIHRVWLLSSCLWSYSNGFHLSPKLRHYDRIDSTIVLRTTTNDAGGHRDRSPRKQLPQGDANSPALRHRRIARVEKFTRLPVWPVWNGVAIWLISKLLGDETAAIVEDTVTGRVCPNFFDGSTSPFIMLVHHCHSFAAWDPLRHVQRSFFPEGFPSHPHRGFVTLTYFFAGGFVHRDSMACRQAYGSHHTNHSQWLNTGAGILHEEMFDNTVKGASLWEQLLIPQRQELYQLWINLPSNDKMNLPSTVLLGSGTTTPTVVTDNTKTLVLAGSYLGQSSSAPTASPLCVLQVTLSPNAKWTIDVPNDYDTALLYLRKGELKDANDATSIPTHSTSYFESSRGRIALEAGPRGADFLFLGGAPLNEPVAAQGSMVMNSYDEINTAYDDYQRGSFGKPWDSKLSDEQWKQHVLQYPSRYRY